MHMKRVSGRRNQPHFDQKELSMEAVRSRVLKHLVSDESDRWRTLSSKSCDDRAGSGQSGECCESTFIQSRSTTRESENENLASECESEAQCMFKILDLELIPLIDAFL